jgi:Tol biopolymer transport system component
MSWSPDGKRAAWWQPRRDSAPEWELWVGNADLSGAQRLDVRLGNPAPVAWSPDGKSIAANSSQFGFSHVVVVPSSGGPVKRATRGNKFEIVVGWSTDGRRIMYGQTVEGGEFTTSIVTLATGQSVPVLPGEKRPFFASWSPDGAHIAYTLLEGSKNTIWVADSVGGNRRQLTKEGFETFPGFLARSPWSPDGKEVLYESRRTGTADLWVAPIDGSAARQLTRDVRNDYNGTWSSDGTWIGFESDRGKHVDLWVVPSAGGVEQRVTDSPAEESDILPQFRPGTHELTFTKATSSSGIWTRDLTAGKEQRLTPDSLRASFFNVAPDGKQVDIVIERGGSIEDLAVVPLAGGPVRTLISGGGYVSNAWWSPDASKIAFQSDRGGTNDIWVIDAAGGSPRQLENWSGSEQSPSWDADGKSVLFTADSGAAVGDIWRVPVAGGSPVRLTHGGIVNTMVGRRGARDVYLSLFNKQSGVLSTGRLRPDGSVNVIYGATNSFPAAISPTGDSVLLNVELPDGRQPVMIFSATGGRGREVLPDGEFPQGASGAWSTDGTRIVYGFRAGGNDHLGVLTLADGHKTRETSGAEDDIGAEWTPDGKSLVFRRARTVSRIYSADLSKLVEVKPKP